MKTLNLTIEGMSCGHCVMAVKKELTKLGGVVVESVEVGAAHVQFDEAIVTADRVIKAVEEAGYRVVS
jgi:copper chaperone